MRPYRIDVFYSEEDGSWVADIPDLKHCSALGRTPQEAVGEVEKAAEAWIEAATEAGLPIPEPTRPRAQAV